MASGINTTDALMSLFPYCTDYISELRGGSMFGIWTMFRPESSNALILATCRMRLGKSTQQGTDRMILRCSALFEDNRRNGSRVISMTVIVYMELLQGIYVTLAFLVTCLLDSSDYATICGI